MIDYFNFFKEGGRERDSPFPAAETEMNLERYLGPAFENPISVAIVEHVQKKGLFKKKLVVLKGPHLGGRVFCPREVKI